MACSDRVFFQARARDERERARATQNACARRVHLELARLYQDRLTREHL